MEFYVVILVYIREVGSNGDGLVNYFIYVMVILKGNNWFRKVRGIVKVIL